MCIFYLLSSSPKHFKTFQQGLTSELALLTWKVPGVSLRGLRLLSWHSGAALNLSWLVSLLQSQLGLLAVLSPWSCVSIRAGEAVIRTDTMELIRKRGLCEIKWRLHAVTLVLWGKVGDSNLIIPLLHSWLRLILNIISLHCFTGQFCKGSVHKFSLCAVVILQALTCSVWISDNQLSGDPSSTMGTLGEHFHGRKFWESKSCASLKCIICCVVRSTYSRRYGECGRFQPSKPAGGNQGNNDRSSPRMCCVHIHSWISTYTDRGKTCYNSAGISQSRWLMCLNKWIAFL